MSKKRVYEFAKELNVDSKTILDNAKGLGIEYGSHMSAMTDDDMNKVKQSLQNKPNGNQSNRNNPKENKSNEKKVSTSKKENKNTSSQSKNSENKNQNKQTNQKKQQSQNKKPTVAKRTTNEQERAEQRNHQIKSG